MNKPSDQLMIRGLVLLLEVVDDREESHSRVGAHTHTVEELGGADLVDGATVESTLGNLLTGHELVSVLHLGGDDVCVKEEVLIVVGVVDHAGDDVVVVDGAGVRGHDACFLDVFLADNHSMTRDHCPVHSSPLSRGAPGTFDLIGTPVRSTRRWLQIQGS